MSDRFRIPTEAFSQIGRTLVAERLDQFSGAGVNRLKAVVERNQQATVGSVRAFPIVDTAVHFSSRCIGVVDPELFSARGIEGDNRVVLRVHVHHIVNDDGVPSIIDAVTGRVRPRDL